MSTPRAALGASVQKCLPRVAKAKVTRGKWRSKQQFCGFATRAFHRHFLPSPIMLKSLTHLKDTQNEPDFRNIGIDRVGIKGLRYPIQVRDKARSLQHTVATLTLTVDLPHHFKGTHMSRFVEVLSEFGPELHVDNIPELLVHLRKRLNSEAARLEVEFPFFLEKKAPVTGAPGLIDYVVRFSATMNGDAVDFLVTVIVPVTTLCPCSKAISAHGAHNQRGVVTYSVRFGKP